MSTVAQPAMREQIIPLHLLRDTLLERHRAASMLNAEADISHVEMEQFAQVDAEANSLLEAWAAQLAIAGSADGDALLNSTALH